MIIYNNKAVFFEKVSTGTWLPRVGDTCVQHLPYGVWLAGSRESIPDKNVFPHSFYCRAWKFYTPTLGFGSQSSY